jgi:hypothetical protein
MANTRRYYHSAIQSGSSLVHDDLAGQIVNDNWALKVSNTRL